jgi:hypothetical protein
VLKLDREKRNRQIRERYRKLHIRKCKNCGKDFEPTKHLKRYCCEVCQTVRFANDKIAQREWHSKNYTYSPELYRKKRMEDKAELDKLIGIICFICGKPKFVFHEIHGKRHLISLKYYKDHPKDFIPLCRKCHYILSFASTRIENFDIEKFYELYKLLSH